MRKRVIITALAAVLFVTGCGGMNASLTPVGKSQATVANQAMTTPAKLEPTLEEHLKAAAPDELMKVLIVLKAPPFDGPPRPDPGTKLTQEEQDAFQARVNSEVTAHYERLSKPFLAKLEGLGYAAEKAITAHNHVSLELKPKHVREIATWEEVHYVETVKYAQPNTGDEGGGLQRPSDFIADPPSTITCGRETNRHGQGYDAKARDCFWQGYTTGKAVTFVTTSLTEEGDPITYEVEVRPPQIRVLVDSKDKFGKEGQFQYICTNMERSSYTPVDTHAPDWQEAKYGFLLKGCIGSETPEVHIP